MNLIERIEEYESNRNYLLIEAAIEVLKSWCLRCFQMMLYQLILSNKQVSKI